MSTRRRRDGEVLKFATCLQIVLFLNNRSIVHFCRRGWLGGWGMVCGCHNCMIPNIKTHLDKKVTFLALVPVLQWNKPSLLLHICTFKMKSNLKHFESSRMTSKHTQLQIFNSSKYHCWKKTYSAISRAILKLVYQFGIPSSNPQMLKSVDFWCKLSSTFLVAEPRQQCFELFRMQNSQLFPGFHPWTPLGKAYSAAPDSLAAQRFFSSLHSSKNWHPQKTAGYSTGLKTCHERPHLVSGHFIMVFYKTTTCPRQQLLSGPKSGRLIQVLLYCWIKSYQQICWIYVL